MSVNNQIINLNILRRQIIKVYQSDNSTIEKNYLKYIVDHNNNGQIMLMTQDMRLVFVEKVDRSDYINKFVNNNKGVKN